MSKTTQMRRWILILLSIVTSLAVGLKVFDTRADSHLTISAPPSGFSNLLDDQGYTNGYFTAFMAPFNRGSLVSGRDYMERFSFKPATFPNNSQVKWNWPAATSHDPIRGFLAIDYGNYYNTIPAIPIISAKVADIKRLSCAFDLTIGGNLPGFDAIIDFFLTSAAGFNKIRFEIEIFLHTPSYAKSYSDSATSIGTFLSKSGTTWKVSIDPGAINGPDILLYPKNSADILTGEVDVKEILSWLTDHKALGGGEFFNGLAIGIEPQQKNGTINVKSLSVIYSPI